jgi:glycosyltransferase involved in cell wall biosynthesis
MEMRMTLLDQRPLRAAHGRDRRADSGECSSASAADGLAIEETGRMRILHVVPTYLPAVRYGGPIFSVHGLCRGLAARGHRVEVFTTNVDGAGESAVPIGVPVPIDGVHVNYFPSKMLRRLYWSPALARALDAAIDRCSLVHLHSVFLWPTWAAARAAKKKQTPYLLSPRGMLVKELIERRSRRAKRAWINLIEKSNLQNAAAIHATSDLEAQELRGFGWRLPRIEVIPNGVDEIENCGNAAVAADVKEIASRQPLVLFLGRISWKKGLDRLVRAFAHTRTGHLAIVGPDEEALAPQVRHLAQDLGISGRVSILPRAVVGADKEYLYASAKLFVLPSYSENFGITVLEAMRRGVPTVVTPEVGAAAIVTESGGGLVVPGEPAPLAGAIGRLVENAEFARSMGEGGKRYVAAHYTWDRIAGQMEKLYAGVLAESQARPRPHALTSQPR